MKCDPKHVKLQRTTVNHPVTKFRPTAKAQFVDALKKDHVTRARQLLARGTVKLQKPVDERGNTALHVAAKHGSSCMCRFLVHEHQSNANATNREGCTPLHLAAAHGWHATCKVLIDL